MDGGRSDRANAELNGCLRQFAVQGPEADSGDQRRGATGLPSHEVESPLRDLPETHRGHLEVGESGTLVHRFDRWFIQRDAEPFFSPLAEKSWAVFSDAFKIWTEG